MLLYPIAMRIDESLHVNKARPQRHANDQPAVLYLKRKRSPIAPYDLVFNF
jgi:hypothetical protein